MRDAIRRRFHYVGLVFGSGRLAPFASMFDALFDRRNGVMRGMQRARNGKSDDHRAAQGQAHHDDGADHATKQLKQRPCDARSEISAVRTQRIGTEQKRRVGIGARDQQRHQGLEGHEQHGETHAHAHGEGIGLAAHEKARPHCGKQDGQDIGAHAQGGMEGLGQGRRDETGRRQNRRDE